MDITEEPEFCDVFDDKSGIRFSTGDKICVKSKGFWTEGTIRRIIRTSPSEARFVVQTLVRHFCSENVRPLNEMSELNKAAYQNMTWGDYGDY